MADLSLFNLGEVLYITEREQGIEQAERTLGAVEQSALEVVAVERGAVVLTGDPEFESIADAGLVTVEWLPRR